MESNVNSASPSPTQIVLAEQVVTGYGWKALAGSVIGFSMDGFDMLILGFKTKAAEIAGSMTSRMQSAIPN